MTGFTRAVVKWLLARWLSVAEICVVGIVAFAWVQTCSTKPAPPAVRRVTTVDTVFRDIPKPTLKFVDRIVYRTVPVDTILMSVVHTDTLIREFCAAAQDTAPQKTSRLFLTAGRYTGTVLDLWGATTAEQAWHGAWSTRPPFEWAVGGDSVAMHQRRVPVFRLNFRQDVVSFLLGGAAALGIQKLLH